MQLSVEKSGIQHLTVVIEVTTPVEAKAEKYDINCNICLLQQNDRAGISVTDA